jgi:hypothetical protein
MKKHRYYALILGPSQAENVPQSTMRGPILKKIKGPAAPFSAGPCPRCQVHNDVLRLYGLASAGADMA